MIRRGAPGPSFQRERRAPRRAPGPTSELQSPTQSKACSTDRATGIKLPFTSQSEISMKRHDRLDVDSVPAPENDASALADGAWIGLFAAEPTGHLAA
jgi:hypothetical protein